MFGFFEIILIHKHPFVISLGNFNIIRNSHTPQWICDFINFSWEPITLRVLRLFTAVAGIIIIIIITIIRYA